MMKSAACCDSPSAYRQPTAREQLLQQREVLEKQLGVVNDALGALDKNPELEEFLTIVGRAVRL